MSHVIVVTHNERGLVGVFASEQLAVSYLAERGVPDSYADRCVSGYQLEGCFVVDTLGTPLRVVLQGRIGGWQD